MSWNGSSKGSDSAFSVHQKQPKDVSHHSSPSIFNFRTLVVGLIVVAFGSAAIWYSLSDAIPESTTEHGLHKIRKAPIITETAQIANATLTSTPKDYSKLSDWDIRHVSIAETNRLSVVQLEYWKQSHPWPLPVEMEQPNWARSRTSIFKDKAHNEIASVVGLEPGTRIFGSHQFDERFTKRFLDSLDKQIVISADDSDYDKWLKQSVIDTKKVLKAAYDRGEDIVQLMNSAKDELGRLGRIKEDIVSLAAEELRKKNSLTEHDEKEMVQIVNRMLEERGMAPLGDESISRFALRRRTRSKSINEE